MSWRMTGVAVAFLSSASCMAQPVYKCQSKGVTVYSHDPCVGATVVDTTPTQGLDKFGGASRKGADVQLQEHRRAIDQALRPLTGLEHQDMQVRRRRVQLPAQAQAECARLDAAVKQQGAVSRKDDDLALFEARKRYRELRC